MHESVLVTQGKMRSLMVPSEQGQEGHLNDYHNNNIWHGPRVSEWKDQKKMMTTGGLWYFNSQSFNWITPYVGLLNFQL